MRAPVLATSKSKRAKGEQLMAARRRCLGVFGTTLAVGALVLGGGVVASPAAASTDSYLNKVRDAGVTSPPIDLELREWGWEICSLLKLGVEPGKVRDQAVYDSSSHPQYGMTVEQADVVMDAAQTDLCNTFK
jgi:hypothetical protein